MRRVRVCSGGCKRTSPSPGRGGVAIACRVLVSLGGSCACQAQQHLKLAASLPRTIRRSAAEEEKCRLTLAETCDTAHPKRQNAAERGRALYRGRTRAERFCNRCGGFIKRAPRGRRNAALGGLVGSLHARLALWLCARCSCSRSRSRAFSGLVALRSRRLVPFRHGDNRCAAEFSLPPAMLVNIDVVIKTWR